MKGSHSEDMVSLLREIRDLLKGQNSRLERLENFHSPSREELVSFEKGKEKETANPQSSEESSILQTALSDSELVETTTAVSEVNAPPGLRPNAPENSEPLETTTAVPDEKPIPGPSDDPIPVWRVIFLLL